MLAMKLISVLVAVIFSLSFVSYGIAAQGRGANQGPGANSGKNLDPVEDLEDDVEEEEEELEELEEIDVEMPEELLMEELEHGIKLK
jgi:hypothetical protein